MYCSDYRNFTKRVHWMRASVYVHKYSLINTVRNIITANWTSTHAFVGVNGAREALCKDAEAY